MNLNSVGSGIQSPKISTWLTLAWIYKFSFLLLDIFFVADI